MKKFLSLMLALIMALGVCGAAVADGKVQVEFWYGLGGALGETIKSFIDEFNASQDKYEIIGVTKGDYTETFQEIQAPIAAGTPPAMTILEYSQVSKLADKNALEDLTPFPSDEEMDQNMIVPRV